MKRSVAAVLLCLAILPPPAFAAPPPEDNLGDPLQVPGLFDTIRVRRYVHDIPHIFAKNDRDALFALGWIHAEDRFFQMDLLRRTFSGTLAELVGKDALASDVQLRTLGLRRAAEASLPALSRSTEVWLESYARGVNAWLADTSHSLPAEYRPLELTRASIPAWTPVDSIMILKGVTFNLSFDLTDINRNVALSAFQEAGEAAGFNGAVLFSEDVYRSAPFDPTVSIPTRLREPRGSSASSYFARAAGLARLYRERARAVRLLRQALERRRDRGSNWWIASGRMTESGRPLLANDAHLELGTPIIFYQAQLRVVPGHTAPMSAFGVTIPGIPGIILGCNTRICWGTSTNPMDLTDVYLEKLVLGPGGVPTGVVFGGQTRPVAPIPQTFRVNTPGDTTADNLEEASIGPLEGGLTLVLPHRNNAPIVQVDLSEPAEPFALSVQYTGWGATREMDSFRIWNRAGTLAEFQRGLQYFDVSSQNWAYADVDGNIAYWTSGELPLREDLQTLERADGGIPPFLIRDGTHTLRHEWLPLAHPQPGQAIPFDILPQAEMPHVINPKRGWVANANNDPIGTSNDNNSLNQKRRGGQGILYLGGSYYDHGFRIGQIERLLEAELAKDGKFSVEDFERIQANNQLLDAQVFVPHILKAFRRARLTSDTSALGALAHDPRIAEAVDRLDDWDFSTPTGIQEGYDPFDDPFDLPAPAQAEIRSSVAATIYSVWRGQVVQRVIDGTLASVGLGDFLPDGDVALADLRHLLETFPRNQGRGASGVQFFTDPAAANPSQARDLALLESLDAALDLLAGPAFAPAFESSTDQDDYRWGKLHRIVFNHPLGEAFSIPPRGGPQHLAPGLPGVARSGGFGVVDASVDTSGPNVRADSVNEFMFGGGPARRFIGEMTPQGPVAEEVIPGGESGVPGSPFRVDQLFLWLTNHYHPWAVPF